MRIFQRVNAYKRGKNSVWRHSKYNHLQGTFYLVKSGDIQLLTGRKEKSERIKAIALFVFTIYVR